MKVNNDIIICGPSASGKTTVARFLFDYLQNKNYNTNLVISNTTRPMRLGEKNNFDYHFCNEQEFNNYDYLEKSEFRGWKYGVPIQNLKKDYCNILILNPIGVKNSISKIDKYIIIYLYEKFFTRFIRSIKREKGFKIEILRRGLTDTIDFWKFEKFCKKNNIKYFKLKNVDSEHTAKSIGTIFKTKILFDNL